MLQPAIGVILAEASRLAALSDKDAAAIRDLHLAARFLLACKDAGLTRTPRVRVLPPQATRTPSSEYRVVEDNESDDRAHWREVDIDGEALRLHEGDIVLSSS